MPSKAYDLPVISQYLLNPWAMKTCVSFLLSLVICLFTKAQNTDLPSPNANLQTLPNGSYVIPMDNTLQTDNSIGIGNFNLNSYGLIVYLLDNNVKIKWVIKAGKAKDDIDFTGMAEELKPTFVAGAVSRNFIAGPFVIFDTDTTGVAALIDGFYSASGLAGNNRPKVFRLSASVSNVDIRYDMTGFVPKAVILTDGGNQAVHVGYMTAASIPAANFSTGTGNDLLTKCYTFASEPHNDKTGAAIDAAISAIKTFVQYGGNFLAQCAAIENYENNPLGRFQTATGITVANVNIGATLNYPNPDLSFSQIQGVYNASSAGSVRNWTMVAGINNEHNHATGTGINSSVIGASVSKMKSGTGGLVFYIGNHQFKIANGIGDINGMRMYMNAFLTPVSINNNCSTGQTLPFMLPVKLIAFNASLDETKVNLTWTTSQEINTNHFVIERSYDAVNFYEAGVMFAYGHSLEVKNYSFTDNVANSPATIIYYRLRSVDIDGKFSYSATRIIRISSKTGNEFSLLSYPNPVSNELRVTVPAAWQNKKVIFEILNANGQVTKRTENANSSQTEAINVSSLTPGFYLVRATCNGESAKQKIIKQ
jgi:hypothetical protein